MEQQPKQLTSTACWSFSQTLPILSACQIFLEIRRFRMKPSSDRLQSETKHSKQLPLETQS